MIEISKIDVEGWEPAIRGMRNPMNSWDKSDSLFDGKNINKEAVIEKGTLLSGIGRNDLDLMMRLAVGGSVHAKYRRMIIVYMDINAPLYWWKEFDTYKVGTVANSCSTMHKIHAKEFVLDDFSHEHLYDVSKTALVNLIEELNFHRIEYLNSKDKNDWWQMIQLLPSSYNQKRTVMLNYEVLSHIYHDRKDHKLEEWRKFCEMIRTLPYSQIITLEEKE